MPFLAARYFDYFFTIVACVIILERAAKDRWAVRSVQSPHHRTIRTLVGAAGKVIPVVLPRNLYAPASGGIVRGVPRKSYKGAPVANPNPIAGLVASRSRLKFAGVPQNEMSVVFSPGFAKRLFFANENAAWKSGRVYRAVPYQIRSVGAATR